jgi:sucrose-6-phosphate hydrolase SacC (GH32 family)
MMQPWVAVEGGTWWLWTSTWDTARGSSSTNIATSTDGIAWTTRNASVPLPEGGSATLFGNRAAWSEGGGWVMLQEVGIPSPWSIYLYRSHDGLAWTLENGGRPVSGLQRHEGGMYGGPSLANVEGVAQPRDADGRYHMWYHAASAAGNLPTNVYHATSTNLTAWAASPAGPVLAHGGAKFEYDQVADPSVALHAGKSFLYYDGDNNRVGSAAIGGAVGATARSRAT